MMTSQQRRQAEQARADIEFLLQTEGITLAYRTAKAMLEDPGTPATAKATALKTLLTLGGFDGKREAPRSDDISEWSPQELQREVDRIMRQLAAPCDGGGAQDVFG